MNDDGTMARRPELIAFAQLPRAQDRHHRRPHRLSPAPRPHRRAQARDQLHQPFRRRMEAAHLCEQVALRRAYRAGQGRHRQGRTGAGAHARDQHARRRASAIPAAARGILRAAMLMIAKEGRGVVVLIREPTLTILSDRVRSMMQGASFVPDLARLRHRRADPARSRRARDDPAFQHGAHHRRARRLRPQRRSSGARSSHRRDEMAAPRILIVEARYYAHISDELLKGAKAALEEAQARYEVVTVPGAFEIPAAIRFAATARESPMTAMSRSAASSAARRPITSMSAPRARMGCKASRSSITSPSASASSRSRTKSRHWRGQGSASATRAARRQRPVSPWSN